MNILGSEVNIKNVIQIVCISIIILMMGILSFQHMEKLGDEITHESVPMFVASGLLTVTLISLGAGTCKWFFWLKNPTFNREIFFSPHFFLWFIIVSEILLVSLTYFAYYNNPDFQYGFIFEIAGIAIIITVLWFLLRTVYEAVTKLRRKE